MPNTLLSFADGNFSASGTWGLVDTASYLDSEAATVQIGTGNTDSQTFTPGAITVDGVALKVAARPVSPAGTMTVTLRNSTSGTDTSSVTVNNSDIDISGYGWVFFKFGSPVTLGGATAYLIRVTSSQAAQITFYRNATLANLSRLLRRTTSPSSFNPGDQFIMVGERASAGSLAARAITMDLNDSVVRYGVSAGITDSLAVSDGATLNWRTDITTYLKFDGLFNIQGGGAVYVGSSATPVASGVTASIEASSSGTNVTAGMYCRPHGTLVMWGASGAGKTIQTVMTASIGGYCSTNGTAITRIKGQSFTGLTGTLNVNGTDRTISSVTDADHLTLTTSAGVNALVNYKHAATASVVTVQATSGWAANEQLGISTTGRSTDFAEFEIVTIQSVDSPTQVTLTTALTKVHVGDGANYDCEVINLTRNVKFFGNSATLQGYINSDSSATADGSVTCRWVEFSKLGSNTAGKRGIESNTGIGFDFQWCSMHDYSVANSIGIRIFGNQGSPVISNNVIANIEATGIEISDQNASQVVQNNTIIGGRTGVNTAGFAGTMTDMRISSVNGSGFIIANPSDNSWVSLNRFVIHTCKDNGWLSTARFSNGNRLQNFRVYHTGQSGVGITFASPPHICNFRVEDSLFYGCGAVASSSTCFDFGCDAYSLYFRNVQTAGDFLIGTSYAFRNNANNKTVMTGLHDQCIYGVTGGDYRNHTSIFESRGSIRTFWRMTLRKCTLIYTGDFLTRTSPASSAFDDLSYPDVEMLRSQFSISRMNGVSGNNLVVYVPGSAASDYAIFYDTPPSQRLIPGSALYKVPSGAFRILLNKAENKTVGVQIRKSATAAGDGQTYNGNAPRLIIRGYSPLGYTTGSLVVAAATGDAGYWEKLSGLLPSPSADGGLEIYVDCDGTTGWVNVDGYTVT